MKRCFSTLTKRSSTLKKSYDTIESADIQQKIDESIKLELQHDKSKDTQRSLDTSVSSEDITLRQKVE